MGCFNPNPSRLQTEAGTEKGKSEHFISKTSLEATYVVGALFY